MENSEKRGSIVKKIISVFMCLTLLFASVRFIMPATVAHAATRQELEEEKKRLDEQIEKNKNELNNLADKKEEQKKYLDKLKEQIAATEKKVNNLQLQVDAIDNEIDGYNKQLKQLDNEILIIKDEIKSAQNQITKTENDLVSTKDSVSAALRVAYVNGKYSTLKLLMGSNDLASFLTRLEMMRRMSEENKKVIDEFITQVEKLNNTKDELKKDESELDEKYKSVEETKALSIERKKELTSKQKEYNSSVSQLENDYAKAEAFVAELDKSSAAYKSYISDLEAEKKAADDEINRILEEYYRSLTTTTVPPTTQGETLPASNINPDTTAPTTASPYNSNESWAWPLGSASSYISSGYGNRSASISGWSFHGGIDISGGGILGKPIYAARSGTVIKAVVVTNDPYGAKWKNAGYANYVLIDHGDGYSTLYGHCWKVNVTTGQTVKKGQQIATVGSTGNSTGAHCHFEVRHNGEKKNPLNYVSH